MRMRMRNALAMTTAAFGLAGLSACSPVPNNLPPAPATPDPGAGYSSNLQPYRIQVGDVLAVRLMLNPELNEEVTVRPDGHISTTVAKDELAYGRTVPEVTSALARDYSADLHNPRLTVVVKSFARADRVYVRGDVLDERDPAIKADRRCVTDWSPPTINPSATDTRSRS